ncbi:sugar ABC transporter permease [Tessaracoccus sp. MC1865]|uniref:sugar ABC transporter permease n=1 Tax=unclassified Tessaracoccus TaxID=2635419 RepID=UPI00096D2EC2|nr:MULTISPECIES: sugar ABC transporter permease [unclassified Tessaracoccus]MBB1483893.1 sugar ABC transporter permease [Tessaracoccus sp. MC1865]MCG6567347.1 sugar ABC transporter permease [Tessaracoccus sp. ZS01]OMG57300.1 sugar ABC transporter permease [Tessaracoccus sp. ZS01]QTO36946.1 sugar ABC transporter permease [Tessaracoccus sp. MC1865]
MARKLANGDNDTRLRGGRWWGQVGWKHILALVVIAYCLFPILYVLSASLNPGGTLTGSNRLFRAFSSVHYERLFTTDFTKWMINSFFVSSVTAIGTVLMGAAAAYAFSRFRFRGRRGGLTALLIIQMFPQMLAFIAIFLLALTLGEIFPILGIGSHLQLIAIYLGGALGANTFLMYGFFNTIPMDIDEAAKIDGATHAQVFWGIIMRLVTPILAVVGLLSFVGSYGEFILAKVILARPENYTLAVGLYVWGSDERNAPWGLFAAGAVIAAIPIILLFMYLQKYIVSGLTAGGVKG